MKAFVSVGALGLTVVLLLFHSVEVTTLNISCRGALCLYTFDPTQNVVDVENFPLLTPPRLWAPFVSLPHLVSPLREYYPAI